MKKRMKSFLLVFSAIVAFAALFAGEDVEIAVRMLRVSLRNREALYLSRFNVQRDDKAVSATWDYPNTNVVVVLSSGASVTNSIPEQMMRRYFEIQKTTGGD